MSKVHEYTQEAMEFAEPYLKQAGDYVSSAAGKVEKVYRRNRRKLKRNMRGMKVKRFLDNLVNITLMIAALLAIVVALLHYFGSKDDQED